MARITQLFPPDMTLSPTLAGRVNQIRQFRNMTVLDLAEASRMRIARIEDIEAGLETWLSDSDRQILANALRIRPEYLKEVEYRPLETDNNSPVAKEVIEDIADSILHGQREVACPRCRSKMTCSVQEGIDLEDKPIFIPMARCTKCPFVLK